MRLILFWSAAALAVYTYIGFPLLIALRGLLRRRDYVEADIEPTVSVIIAAHNESRSIRVKLENVLSLDYPAGRLEVIIASDGSTDGTDAIVQGYAQQGVRLLSLPRQGKAPALNAAVAASTGEILDFSDANSMYAPQAIRNLMRPFADAAVGGVAGNQCYLKESITGEANPGEHSYWDFDRTLKRLESAAGNTISATGAIYAIRRSLFQPVPGGVTDDFTLSTGVIAQGRRLVFAPDAIAYEPASGTSEAEFARKVRVITRGLRAVQLRRELLNPLRHGFYAVQLFSHKVLRRLIVLPLLVLMAVTPLLWAKGRLYRLATLGEAVFLGCSAAGYAFRHTELGAKKVFAIPFYFAMVNIAALMAVINMVRGRKIERWEPQRVAESSGD